METRNRSGVLSNKQLLSESDNNVNYQIFVGACPPNIVEGIFRD